MFKTLPSIAEVVGSIPGQETKVPHAAQCRQNKQKHLIARTVLKKIFKKMLKKTVKEENRKDLFSFL